MRRDLYRLLAPVSGDITARGLCEEEVRVGGDAGKSSSMDSRASSSSSATRSSLGM